MMSKKGLTVQVVFLVALFLLPSLVLAVDTDGDGLDDDNECWTAEWFACIEECQECDGKVTKLTLQYNGAQNATVRVEQKDGTVVFNGTVAPGGQFTFSGTDKQGTLGTDIFIFVNNVQHTKIHTSCSQPIGPGLVSGDFEVISGESRNGGLLCPLNGNGGNGANGKRVRLDVCADPNLFDTDSDGLNDFEERLFNLNPNDSDTDTDGLDEGNLIYTFPDECPKHCDDFCVVHSADFWRDVVCDEEIPPPQECQECDGKVTKLTLQYNGAQNATVRVEQKDGTVVFNGTVAPGGQFTFSGIDKQGTLGTDIFIFVNNVQHTKIHTSCSQPIGPGLVSGDFEVISGESRNGGLICPLDGNGNGGGDSGGGGVSIFDELLDDYLFKINHLSSIFNSVDLLKQIFFFGLGNVWKYDDTNTDFNDSWVELNFDDSGWSSGNAYLGFGETLITTTLDFGNNSSNKTVTYYFRKHFNVFNASAIDNLQLNIDYDDGFVAYLNGNELLRSSGASTDHNTFVPYHESTIGDSPSSFLVHDFNSTELGFLVDGDNVIAVEMHLNAPTSSDIVLGAFLVSFENITSQGLADNLTQVCDILSSDESDEDILKRKLLALWLNVVSAGICDQQIILHNGLCKDIPADTIEELIGLAENALINNLTSDYEDLARFIMSINIGECIDCAGPCPQVGEFCTYTPGGWGNPGVSEPGSLRDSDFSTVFPSGLVVGGTLTLKLSTAQDVEDFLPSGGTPSALTQNWVNPGQNYNNTFAGQLVAVTLNVEFSKAGLLGDTDLENLIISSGPAAGLTVGQLLAIANTALGGGTTSLTISQLTDALASINENFVDCAVNKGSLTCPDDGKKGGGGGAGKKDEEVGKEGFTLSGEDSETEESEPGVESVGDGEGSDDGANGDKFWTKVWKWIKKLAGLE